jgi:hypothetical protein
LGLTNLDPTAALPQEKSALAALQRAFTKSRYLLRFLAPRERVDDARRLSGKLEGAGAWRRPTPAASDDPRTTALLKMLGELGHVAGLAHYTTAEANQLSAVAEALLKMDASLASTADAFMAASRAIAAGKSPQETAALIDAAAIALAQNARAGAAQSPAAPDASVSRVNGALADALHRQGGIR